MVVELNLSGYRKPVNELYPSDENFKNKWQELDIPITFGSDAHAKNQVGLNSEELWQKLKKFGYTKTFAIFKNRDRNFVEFWSILMFCMIQYEINFLRRNKKWATYKQYWGVYSFCNENEVAFVDFVLLI